MENKPFNENSWSNLGESKSDKSETKKDNTTSKTALSLGKVAERPFFSRTEEAPETRQQTVWERLRGEENPRQEPSVGENEHSVVEADEPALAESSLPAEPLEQLRRVIAEHRNALASEPDESVPGEVDAGKLSHEADALLLENTDVLSFQQAESAPTAIINEAYDQTAEQVQEAFHASTTQGAQQQNQARPAREMPDVYAAASNSENATSQLPLAESGGAAGGGLPPRSPEQPSTADQPDMPEDPRLYGAVSPVPASSETTINGDSTSTEDWYYAGQRRGTIAGLAVGYFVGRRGGRKRAERRFASERKKYEKQTAKLGAALGNKEQQIRQLTQRQVETVTPKQYPRVSERLQAELPLIERVDKLQPSVVPKVERPVEVRKSLQPAEKLQFSKPELASEQRSRYAEVIPFTKTSAELNWRELRAIAEKIQIEDQLTLKDMYEAQRFDEKALRRIISVFLEGGNVRRAITHEVTEHDKHFERDPLLRQAQDNGATSGGGSDGKVEQAFVQSGHSGDGKAGQVTTTFKQLPGQPKPSPEVLKVVKQRQAASVAVVVLLIFALVFLMIALSKQ